MKWKKLTTKSKLCSHTFLLFNEWNSRFFWCYYSRYHKNITIYPINNNESTTILSAKEVKSMPFYWYLLLPKIEPKSIKSFDILNHGINCPGDCECQKYKNGFALAYEFSESLEQYIKQVGEESYPPLAIKPNPS